MGRDTIKGTLACTHYLPADSEAPEGTLDVFLELLSLVSSIPHTPEL